MTVEILLTIAVVLLFLNILVLSIRLNNHANRLDYLESKDYDSQALDEQPIEIYFSDETVRYTSIPSTLHDAEKSAK